MKGIIGCSSPCEQELSGACHSMGRMVRNLYLQAYR